MALDFVCVRVKKEQDWDGVSEAAVSAGLYAGHEIKEEMVLGPEVLQPSDVAFMLRSQDRDKTPDFSPGTAAPEPLAAPRHPGPGSKGAPVKRERDEELPMVRIHSPYGFDDLYPTTNPATPATEPDAIHESQTSPNLQKHWTLYDIRPCFIPLVPIDSVEYRSQNKNSTAKMRKPIDRVTKENRSENKSLTDEMRKPKKFFCDFCSKGFSIKQRLLIHIRIHTGEKPHSCRVCRKKFSDLSILIRHRRIHTGEKPHACDVCKKQFGEKYLLKYHKRLHTGETAYTCRLCSKTFNHISNLKRHIRAHENKPFACEICNQHFSKQSKLEAHLLSHLKDKSFCCDICKKCFGNTGHLNRHLKVHFDDKKHYCKVCTISFTQLGSLKRHEMRNICRKR